MRPISNGDVADTAQMVKLVDTPASGAGDRKVVEVRVFFWAPIQKNRANGSVFCFSVFETVAVCATSTSIYQKAPWQMIAIRQP